MKEAPIRHPAWYWLAVVLLALAGAGAFWLPNQAGQRAVRSEPSRRVDEAIEPTIEQRADQFRAFRQEVSQLSAQEQQDVWLGLQQRTESEFEKTMYEFFALPPQEQLEVIDRTIDRFQWYSQAGIGRRYGDHTAAVDPPWRMRGGPVHVREVGGQGPWNRPFTELSLEDRLLRREIRDDGTPQMSVMREELKRLMSDRRKQRGIPEPVRRWG